MSSLVGIFQDFLEHAALHQYNVACVFERIHMLYTCFLEFDVEIYQNGALIFVRFCNPESRNCYVDDNYKSSTLFEVMLLGDKSHVALYEM